MSSDFDLSAVERHVCALGFRPGDFIELRLIRDAGPPTRSWHPIDADGRAPSLLDYVFDGIAIHDSAPPHHFVSLNPRPAHGASGNDSVERAYSVAADCDLLKMGAAASADEGRAWLDAKLGTLGLPARFAIWSGGGTHVYFRLAEPLTDLKLWRGLQAQLARALDVSNDLNNPERLVRLVGTPNHKPGRTAPAVLIDEPGAVVTLDELRARLDALAPYEAPRDPDRSDRPPPDLNPTTALGWFLTNHSVRDVLRTHGYGISGFTVTRPGGERPSGRLEDDRRGVEIFVSYSTNDPLNDEKFNGAGRLDCFDALRVLAFDGDEKLAHEHVRKLHAAHLNETVGPLVERLLASVEPADADAPDEAGNANEPADADAQAEAEFDVDAYVANLEADEPGAATPPGPSTATTTTTKGPKRRRVAIISDEAAMLDELRAALNADPSLFRRGPALVRVLDDGTIDEPKAPALREHVQRLVTFTRCDAKGRESAAPMPARLETMLCQPHPWARPVLKGVRGAPLLRPDGSIHAEVGYDPATGYLYRPADPRPLPPIPENPDRDDAVKALDKLDELLADFDFTSPAGRAAALGLLLTPLARTAYGGCTPGAFIDASTAGSGKTLLATVANALATGSRALGSVQYDRSDRFDKALIAALCAARPVLTLDNVVGSLESPLLDQCLTGETVSFRPLFTDTLREVPNGAMLIITGNNAVMSGDLSRRLTHVRLEPQCARPEQRTGFTHPDLPGYVLANRPELLAAGLTTLRAYIRAGRPRQVGRGMGSFEGWARLVRDCLLWCGRPDVATTQEGLLEADPRLAAYGAMLAEWARHFPGPVTAGRLVRAAWAPSLSNTFDELRGLLAELVGGRTSDVIPPSTVALGKVLGSLVGRHFGNLQLQRHRTAEGTAYLVLRDGAALPAPSGPVLAPKPEPRARLSAEPCAMPPDGSATGAERERYLSKVDPEMQRALLVATPQFMALPEAGRLAYLREHYPTLAERIELAMIFAPDFLRRYFATDGDDVTGGADPEPAAGALRLFAFGRRNPGLFRSMLVQADGALVDLPGWPEKLEHLRALNPDLAAAAELLRQHDPEVFARIVPPTDGGPGR